MEYCARGGSGGGGIGGLERIPEVERSLLHQQKATELELVQTLVQSSSRFSVAKDQVRRLMRDVELMEQRISMHSAHLLAKRLIIQHIERENNTLQRRRRNLAVLQESVLALQRVLQLDPEIEACLGRLQDLGGDEEEEDVAAIAAFFKEDQNVVHLSKAMLQMQAVIQDPDLARRFPIAAVAERRAYFLKLRRLIVFRSKEFLFTLIDEHEKSFFAFKKQSKKEQKKKMGKEGGKVSGKEKTFLDPKSQKKISPEKTQTSCSFFPSSGTSQGESSRVQLIWSAHDALHQKLLQMKAIIQALARIDMEGFMALLRRYRLAMSRMYAAEMKTFFQTLWYQLRTCKTKKKFAARETDPPPFLLGSSKCSYRYLSSFRAETLSAGDVLPPRGTLPLPSPTEHLLQVPSRHRPLWDAERRRGGGGGGASRLEGEEGEEGTSAGSGFRDGWKGVGSPLFQSLQSVGGPESGPGGSPSYGSMSLGGDRSTAPGWSTLSRRGLFLPTLSIPSSPEGGGEVALSPSYAALSPLPTTAAGGGGGVRAGVVTSTTTMTGPAPLAIPTVPVRDRLAIVCPALTGASRLMSHFGVPVSHACAGVTHGPTGSLGRGVEHDPAAVRGGGEEEEEVFSHPSWWYAAGLQIFQDADFFTDPRTFAAIKGHHQSAWSRFRTGVSNIFSGGGGAGGGGRGGRSSSSWSSAKKKRNGSRGRAARSERAATEGGKGPTRMRGGGGTLRPDMAVGLVLECVLSAILMEELVLSECFGVAEGWTWPRNEDDEEEEEEQQVAHDEEVKVDKEKGSARRGRRGKGFNTASSETFSVASGGGGRGVGSKPRTPSPLPMEAYLPLPPPPQRYYHETLPLWWASVSRVAAAFGPLSQMREGGEGGGGGSRRGGSSSVLVAGGAGAMRSTSSSCFPFPYPPTTCPAFSMFTPTTTTFSFFSPLAMKAMLLPSDVSTAHHHRRGGGNGDEDERGGGEGSRVTTSYRGGRGGSGHECRELERVRHAYEHHHAELLLESLSEIFFGEGSSAWHQVVHGIGARVLWLGHAVAKTPQVALRRRTRVRGLKRSQSAPGSGASPSLGGGGGTGGEPWEDVDQWEPPQEGVDDEWEDLGPEEEKERKRGGGLLGSSFSKDHGEEDGGEDIPLTSTPAFLATQRALRSHFLFQTITGLVRFIGTHCDKLYAVPILSIAESLTKPFPSTASAYVVPSGPTRTMPIGRGPEGSGVGSTSSVTAVGGVVDWTVPTLTVGAPGGGAVVDFSPPPRPPLTQSTFCMILLREVEKTMGGVMLEHIQEQVASIERAKRRFYIRPTPLFCAWQKLPVYVYRMEALMNALYIPRHARRGRRSDEEDDGGGGGGVRGRGSPPRGFRGMDRDGLGATLSSSVLGGYETAWERSIYGHRRHRGGGGLGKDRRVVEEEAEEAEDDDDNGGRPRREHLGDSNDEEEEEEEEDSANFYAQYTSVLNRLVEQLFLAVDDITGVSVPGVGMMAWPTTPSTTTGGGDPGSGWYPSSSAPSSAGFAALHTTTATNTTTTTSPRISSPRGGGVVGVLAGDGGGGVGEMSGGGPLGSISGAGTLAPSGSLPLPHASTKVGGFGPSSRSVGGDPISGTGGNSFFTPSHPSSTYALPLPFSSSSSSNSIASPLGRREGAPPSAPLPVPSSLDSNKKWTKQQGAHAKKKEEKKRAQQRKKEEKKAAKKAANAGEASSAPRRGSISSFFSGPFLPHPTAGSTTSPGDDRATVHGTVPRTVDHGSPSAWSSTSPPPAPALPPLPVRDAIRQAVYYFHDGTSYSGRLQRGSWWSWWWGGRGGWRPPKRSRSTGMGRRQQGSPPFPVPLGTTTSTTSSSSTSSPRRKTTHGGVLSKGNERDRRHAALSPYSLTSASLGFSPQMLGGGGGGGSSLGVPPEVKWRSIQQYRHHTYFCTFYQTLSTLCHSRKCLRRWYEMACHKRDHYERLYLERVLFLQELPLFGSFTTAVQELLEVYSESELRHHRAVSVEVVQATVAAMEVEIVKGVPRCAARMRQHFLRDVAPDSPALQFHKTLLQRTWQHFCLLLEDRFAFMESLLKWEVYVAQGIRLRMTKTEMVLNVLNKV